MSAPVAQHPSRSVVEFIERHDTLRMIMDWIADCFADTPEVDTSIDWEDGEEHDEDRGSAAL